MTKKKEVTEDASVQNDEAKVKEDSKKSSNSSKSKNTKEVFEQPTESSEVPDKPNAEELSEGTDDFEGGGNQPIIMPISMIYKGKRYNVGQDLTGFNDEVIEALLVKLLTMMGDPEEEVE